MRPSHTSINSRLIKRLVHHGQTRSLDEMVPLVRTQRPFRPPSPGEGMALPRTKHIHEIADQYQKKTGREPLDRSSKDLDASHSKIASAYKKMDHNPDHPKVKASYDALKGDLHKQWEHLQNHGFSMSLTKGQPYKDHHEMIKDIKSNRHIKVWEGDGHMPDDHPLKEVHPASGHKYNTIFRAVHDILGHATSGHDFSQHGEENAYHHHKQMFSEEAHPALFTETKAQTSYFYNNGHHPQQKAGIINPKDLKESNPRFHRVFNRLVEKKKDSCGCDHFHSVTCHTDPSTSEDE